MLPGLPAEDQELYVDLIAWMMSIMTWHGVRGGEGWYEREQAPATKHAPEDLSPSSTELAGHIICTFLSSDFQHACSILRQLGLLQPVDRQLAELPDERESHLYRVKYDVGEIRLRMFSGSYLSAPSLLEVIACQKLGINEAEDPSELKSRIDDFMHRQGFAQLLTVKLEERDCSKNGGSVYPKFPSYMWSMSDFVSGQWAEAIEDVWMGMSKEHWEDIRSGKDVDLAAIFADVLQIPLDQVDADAVRKLRILVAGGPASRRFPI
jgi:hypothetical protein